MQNRWLVLAVLCLAAFTINLDVTIVNVALPAFVRELGASTTELQWIVDGYNLSFAALVLAAGSLGDRFGRRRALMVGLVLFGLGNALATQMDSAGSLIACRFLMGVGAAVIFPTTLSIISNVFTDRGERAKAIGAWGAMTGLGVAFGPIVGGWLLNHFWWGSVFWVAVPLSLLGLVAAVTVVPDSADPDVPPLDLVGLAVSVLTLASLVTAIIEGPNWGWRSGGVLSLFAVGLVLLVAFVAWERRVAHPMLDVRLFTNLRFSAASAAIAFGSFALFGFIFLITQYFQFLRGYSALETGVRIIPVATSIAVTSVVGTRLAVRFGNKAVVAAGLTSLTAGYWWVSTASGSTRYLEIVGQMILLGGGMGLTTAPATESIMGAVPVHQAGQGSAVNDATREIGGTLGVAIIGSVFASLFTRGLGGSAWEQVPVELREAAGDGIGPALAVAEQAADQLGAATSQALVAAARSAFLDGMQAGCLVAGAVTATGALVAARWLPARPGPSHQPDRAPVDAL